VLLMPGACRLMVCKGSLMQLESCDVQGALIAAAVVTGAGVGWPP